MKTILATFALAFLAAGCVADQGTDIGQDEAALQAAHETPAEEATDMPDLDSQPSPQVFTNCILFCESEFQDCLASGGTKAECRVVQSRCIRSCPL
jgi:hypothetical protein